MFDPVCGVWSVRGMMVEASCRRRTHRTPPHFNRSGWLFLSRSEAKQTQSLLRFDSIRPMPIHLLDGQACFLISQPASQGVSRFDSMDGITQQDLTEQPTMQHTNADDDASPTCVLHPIS